MVEPPSLGGLNSHGHVALGDRVSVALAGLGMVGLNDLRGIFQP